MNRARRLWLAVVPAALVAGVFASWIIIESDHIDRPRLVAVLTLLGSWSFILAGLIARSRRPLNRTGSLMIAVGFWWLAGSLFAANESWVWTIGLALSVISAGFLVHLLVAYPSGRLDSTWDRGLVAAGYALVVLANVPFLLIDPQPISRCEECPESVLLVSESETAGDVFKVIVETVAVVFLLTVVATLFARWRRSSAAARRGLTPVLLAGSATLMLFAVSVGTMDRWPEIATAADWAAHFAFVGIPFVFLSGFLKSRLARADISRALAEESAQRLPEETQASVRRLLHDPTAEVLFTCADPADGYVDAQGRRREAVAEPGRAITPIERDGRPLAAILHDAALLNEPDLLEQVAAAIGLEIERDRNLHALQASERRNRALVDAMPDNMFRISTDGTFLDIQESPAPGLRRVEAKVGSSIYDYPAPRDLVDRVMFAGRLALATGQLETIEWELGTKDDMRHQEGRFMPSGEDEFLLVVRDVTARKRQETEQAALHRVALAVASEGRPEQIFDLVAKEVAGVLGAHAVNLVRYDLDEEETVVVGGWGDPAATHPVGSRGTFRETASGAVYRAGGPLRFELGKGNVPPELVTQMRWLGVDSLVAAPITLEGRQWGAVVAVLMAPHSFPPGAEERLGAFTRLVSLALANEEAREALAASRARLVTAGDEERRRLERNLHDGAQQRLVSLSLSLRLAKAKLQTDPGAARELLEAAGSDLGIALEELRELARGIHPAVLTERGLAPALESLADRASLPVELEVDPEVRFPSRVEAAAYYVVSEALANVAKYARAASVEVSVAHENGFAIVEVADDGVGGANPQHGSGLRGLNDRVEALGGVLIVHSPRGEGTTIRAEIPLAEQTDSDGSRPGQARAYAAWRSRQSLGAER